MAFPEDPSDGAATPGFEGSGPGEGAATLGFGGPEPGECTSGSEEAVAGGPGGGASGSGSAAAEEAGGPFEAAAGGGSQDDYEEADLLGAPGISEELATTAAADEMFAEAEGVPAPPEGLSAEPADQAAVADPAAVAGQAAVADPAAVAASVVAQERDDYRDALVRLQADFENYKKRVAKQHDDLRQRAAEALVEKLLPVLDTADLALSHGGGEDVKQIWAALYGALEKEGLDRIDDPGSPFDPTLHDAVAHEPGEEGAQEVAEVLRAGYRWRGRVLRPAMVKVRG